MRSLIFSLLSLVLLLSLFGNAYLYYSHRLSAPQETMQTMSSVSASGGTAQVRLPPLAFGNVVLPALPAQINACDELQRGGKDNGECRALRAANVPAKGPQPAVPATAKTVALTPLHFTFTMSGDTLPHLPQVLTLYRDQGAKIDFQPFLKTLDAMHVPLDTATFTLIPDSVRLQSPDGVYTVLLEPFKRTTTVLRRYRQSGYTLDATKLTLPPDETLIAAASEFALSLGIQPDIYGTPTVLHPLTVSGSLVRSSVDVLWPMTLDSKPVIDAQAQPVGILAITLSLPSLTPQELVLRQFDADILAQSDYTAASVDALQSGIQLGGLRPPFSFEKGTKQKVPVADAALAYLFLQDADGRVPTYFVPVILTTLNLPATCSTCSTLAWRSFVPALDRAHFSWAKTAAPIESKNLVR